MGDFNIQVEATAAEVHDVLLAELEDAELDPETATAARYGIRAALTFLDVVGDASVDAGVDISIEGDSGKSIMVSAVAVPATETPDAMNVPVDEMVVAEEQAPLAVTGQVTPETASDDPLVDNVPGHPEAEWVESTPAPAEVDELVVEAEEEDEPEIDIEGKTIEQILWQVGDDRSLAEEALTQEEASPRPRKSLIADLEAIIESGGA